MHPVPKHDSRTVCLCERCNYMPSSEHRMHGECEDLTPRYRLCKNACTNSIIIIYEYDNTYIALNVHCSLQVHCQFQRRFPIWDQYMFIVYMI